MPIPTVHAQSELITISKRDLKRDGIIDLSRWMWKYHDGDNPEWADPTYDDINWEPAYTKMESGGMLDTHWSGIGWFRLHVEIDSSLTGVPIGLNMHQNGASDIYINGRLIKRFGKVSQDKSTEHTKVNTPPFWVPMKAGRDYVIAIRFSDHQYRNFLSHKYFDLANIYKGFHLSLGNYNTMLTQMVRQYHQYYFLMILLLGITLTIFFIHLILYFYYPEQNSNLFYAITIGCFALIVFFEVYLNLVHSLTENIIILIIDLICFIELGPMMLRFTYSVNKRKPPRYFYYILTAGFILSVLTVFFVIRVRFFASIFFLICMIESARILTIHFYKHKQGSGIILAGTLLTILLGSIQMLVNIGVLSLAWQVHRGILAYYGILGVIISMSVYLGKEIARTNHDLKNKLREVARLSDINRKNDLKQAKLQLSAEKEKARTREANLRAQTAELKLQVEEAERKALEAEHLRKTEELEEARKLQLSMLPNKLPDINGLELAVHMETATEVGGDYYDFHQGSDDELTLTIGDATGHGLKAGTLVTAVKSLFPILSNPDNIPSVFHSYTKSIKNMNFGILYMGLTMAHFESVKPVENDPLSEKCAFNMTISAAGMPPVFLFRAAKHQTETIILKGMPLGTVPNFPYQQKRYPLYQDDVLLFLTDGFLELFNPQKEMLGNSRAKEIFTQIATKSPEDIIHHLKTAARQWKKDLPVRDDMTFIVVKIHVDE